MSNKKCIFIFFLVFGLLFQKSVIVLADGTYAAINTAFGNDGGADQLNFSQGKVWTIDNYGKYIWVVEGRSGIHHWTWSNDQGANWSEGSEDTNFITRGSVAYDTIDDKLHVIWTTNTCDSGGGIIYRRYGITRDGSNNITAITREDSSNINLQLDITGDISCQQPVALWVNDGTTHGTLVAVWSKMGTNQTEIRASKRTLSLSAADGVAANWAAPDGTGDSFTNAPAVAADKVHARTSTGAAQPSALIRGGSGSRKDDLYIFVAEAVGASQSLLAYRGVWSSGSGDWSGGWQSPVTVGAIDNASGGYSAKYELLTKPVLDTTNDRLYIGWARWKTGGSGDTVSIAYLDSSDSASSTIDLYSANGTHSYAPTLDIAYDSTQGLIYAAYIESTTNGDNGSIDYKTYDGTTLSSGTRFYTSPGGSGGADGSADIPILYDNRSSNDRLLFAFRVNGSLPPTLGDPHVAYWGYITLPTPTPTPTATPTSVPLSQPGIPQCNDVPPLQQSYLADAKVVSSTEINLIYSSWSSFYTLEYGYSKDKFDFAVSGIPGGSFAVKSLLPSTTYYFRVAVKNGCTIGPWSNVISAKTSGNSILIPGLVGAPSTPKPTIPSVQNLLNPDSPTNTNLINQPSPSPAGSPTAAAVVQTEDNETSFPVKTLAIVGGVALLGLIIIIVIMKIL